VQFLSADKICILSRSPGDDGIRLISGGTIEIYIVMNFSHENGTCWNTTNDVTPTSSDDTTSFHLEVDFSHVPMSVLLTATSMFANFLVLLCIVGDKKLHRPANYYIFSLSVNELIISVIPVNGLLVYEIFQAWPLGLVVCKVS
jgi:NADH:ubiquinone oxidoreductase subunit 4 (subunit M)